MKILRDADTDHVTTGKEEEEERKRAEIFISIYESIGFGGKRLIFFLFFVFNLFVCLFVCL